MIDISWVISIGLIGTLLVAPDILLKIRKNILYVFILFFLWISLLLFFVIFNFLIILLIIDEELEYK